MIVEAWKRLYLRDPEATLRMWTQICVCLPQPFKTPRERLPKWEPVAPLNLCGACGGEVVSRKTKQDPFGLRLYCDTCKIVRADHPLDELERIPEGYRR